MGVVKVIPRIALGNQRVAVDVHLAAGGGAGVLADHVTAVPDVVADGGVWVNEDGTR